MKRHAPWWTLVCSAALVAGTAACATQSGGLGGAAVPPAVPPASSDTQAQPQQDGAAADSQSAAPAAPAEQQAAALGTGANAESASMGATGAGQVDGGVPVSDDLAAGEPAPIDASAAAADPLAAPPVVSGTVAAPPSGLQLAGFIPGPGCPPGTTTAAISYGRISIEFLDKFSVLPNQGRIQCTAQVLVKVPAGFQFTLGDYKQNYAPPVPLQAGQAMFSGRLNGTASKALVDFSWTIPATPPVTLNRSHNYAGGSVVWNNSLGDFVFPANTVLPFSACSSQATTQTIALTIDLAAASNYVLPWPPPPFAQSERLFLNAIRFAPKWQGC